MAKVTVGKKACAVNPLKMSQPIGGAFAFMGLRGCDAAAARFAGLHVVRTDAVRAAFQGSGAAADHRDERSRDRARRLRECRAGHSQHPQAHQAGDHRHLLDRRHRNQGRRRRGLPQADPAKAPGAGDISRWSMSRPPTSRMRSRTAGKRPSRAWSRCWSRRRRTRRRRDPKRVNVLPGCHLTPGRSRRAAGPSSRISGSSRPSCPISPVRSTAISPMSSCRPRSAASASTRSRPWARRPGPLPIGAQMRRAAEAMETKTGVPFRLFERLCGLHSQ